MLLSVARLKIITSIIISKYFFIFLIKLTRKINKRAILFSKQKKINVDSNQNEIAPNEISQMVKFHMNSMEICFNDSQKEDFMVKFSKSEILYKKCVNYMNINFNLADIEVIDNKCEKTKIISCSSFDDSEKFIDIDVTKTNRNSYEYKLNHTSFNITIKIGGINAKYHPLRINHIINIFRKISLDEESESENASLRSHLIKEEIPTCIKNQNAIVISAILKHIDITFINVKTNSMIFAINADSPKVNVSVYNDHFKIEGALKNCELYSMTNYPNTITSANVNSDVKREKVLSAKMNSQSLIDFKVDIFSNTCPLMQDRVSSIVNMRLNSVYFIYMQEELMRILSYMTNEIIPSLSHKDEKSDVKVIKDEDETKMQLNITAMNPQLIFKPKYESNEEFIIDFGRVDIVNKYNANDIYKIHTFQIQYNNAMISDNENKYKLCPSFNGCLNIHMFTHKEIEWKDYTQVDWMVNEIKMTMRMNDYINLINCFYSNIAYSDNKNSLFTFDEFKNNSLIERNL